MKADMRVQVPLNVLFLWESAVMFECCHDCRLTPWLTGAGARSAEGTNIGHENGEAMAYVGVRVEPPVRLGSEGTELQVLAAVDFSVVVIHLLPSCAHGFWH